jgi:hypothetical protein
VLPLHFRLLKEAEELSLAINVLRGHEESDGDCAGLGDDYEFEKAFRQFQGCFHAANALGAVAL